MGLSHLDAEVVFLTSPPYKATAEVENTAKKHIKIEIRNDFHIKNRFLYLREKAVFSLLLLFLCFVLR